MQHSVAKLKLDSPEKTKLEKQDVKEAINNILDYNQHVTHKNAELTKRELTENLDLDEDLINSHSKTIVRKYERTNEQLGNQNLDLMKERNELGKQLRQCLQRKQELEQYI